MGTNPIGSTPLTLYGEDLKIWHREQQYQMLDDAHKIPEDIRPTRIINSVFLAAYFFFSCR